VLDVERDWRGAPQDALDLLLAAVDALGELPNLRVTAVGRFDVTARLRETQTSSRPRLPAASDSTRCRSRINNSGIPRAKVQIAYRIDDC
jgi:hypothetical protein